MTPKELALDANHILSKEQADAVSALLDAFDDHPEANIIAETICEATDWPDSDLDTLWLDYRGEVIWRAREVAKRR